MTNMIAHNLEIAKPNFLYFIVNINKEIAQWIQYKGVEVKDDQLFFCFKSSQNSLSFKVYAGVNVNDIFYLLQSKSNEIYEYFKQLKYQNI